jgi:hypothetical protein
MFQFYIEDANNLAEEDDEDTVEDNLVVVKYTKINAERLLKVLSILFLVDEPEEGFALHYNLFLSNILVGDNFQGIVDWENIHTAPY